MAWTRWRKNKFGREKVSHSGMRFDSKLEAAVYDILKLMERAGEIKDLRHHPGTTFLTRARVQSRPDFSYTNPATGETEYAEAKGFETPEYRIKLRLWRFYGPGKIHIWKGSHSKPFLHETVTPKGDDDV